jgi:hypothetical protein
MDGWRSKKMNNFLEKMSYITSFIDGKSLATNIKANIFLRTLIKIYSVVARLRCQYHFYHFTPEFYLMKFLRRFL